MVTLDIFSDPVCPWCMIGKAHLDRALERIGDHPFRIEWHPFQLNPDLPKGGADRREYLEAKFGGQMAAAKAYLTVQQAAEAAGVEFNIDRIARQPNTLDAHRLIHWAGLEGAQTPVVAGLFRAYFRDGRDIGQAEVLADIAAEAGMDRDVVLRLLGSGADADDIAARDLDARKKGVRAVPTFLIARQYVVSGAQPPELWEKVAADIAAQARQD
ncbi:Predicted dithiol-disulfide isomerase, DsbA family [Gemmobacter megaterium]|uniref:Predicted dithiol-disulfide isomerase, DsbA family n=1 Tax=Gemmobacter megaterium TaxID=1086013 RepID=A0A1N7P192_9RHOB|nr:DsbA family oxidoreductase [Gemmobacter megaterium]GGE15188.1 polyketide biosynthesis protein [Gemmobacter megaterium]SIT04343.1 Predicted dithiol-disulfide isomerase, DsbA family [Gemmobacter megaterium]